MVTTSLRAHVATVRLATATSIPQLLAAASASATIVNVETHRAPIEEVISDLYRDWRS